MGARKVIAVLGCFALQWWLAQSVSGGHSRAESTGQLDQEAPVGLEHVGLSLMRREDDSGPAPATGTTTTFMGGVHVDTKGEASKGIWAGKYTGKTNKEAWKDDKSVSVNMAKAVAWILIGMICVMMALVYLVHYPDDHIKHATWHTISNSLSLFCAVLFFKVLKLTVKVIKGKAKAASLADDGTSSFLDLDFNDLSDESEGGAGEPDAATIIAYFMFFLSFFVMLECLLLFCKKRPFQLAAWGLTGAHLVGFMAAYCFGTMQMAPPFRNSAAASFCIIPIAALTIGFMCYMAGSVRSLIIKADGEEDAIEHEWQHQCVHTEDEIIAFSVGLLITQAFRFAIMGDLPYFSGPQFTNEVNHIIGLFFIALLFLVLVVLSDIAERYAKSSGSGPGVRRFLGSLTCTFAMTVGWCLLFWGKWFFWRVTGNGGVVAEGNILLMQMEMAVGFSVVSFAVIIALDFLGDRLPNSMDTLKAVAEAFELLISLSWEALFMTAIAEAMYSGYNSKIDRLWQGSKLCIGLWVIIMPGWILYILPKALHSHGHGHGHDDHGHEDAKGHGHDAAEGGDKPGALAEKQEAAK